MEQGKKGRPSQQSAAAAKLGYTGPQVPAADLQAQQAAALQYAQVQAAYAAQQQAAAAQGYTGQVGISCHFSWLSYACRCKFLIEGEEALQTIYSCRS